MKKLFAIAALAAFVGTASAADIALWTFESSVPVSAGPFTAEAGDNALTSNASGTTNGTYSNPVGNGSPESFSSNGWDVGDYYQFTTSTIGYTGITLTFDQTSSSTGPRDFAVQFSTDGISFSTALSYAVLINAAPNAPWTQNPPRNAAYTFSTGILADNVASLTVRLVQTSNVSTNGGTVAATGTSRVDNVQISGNIPTPGSLGLMGVAGLVAVRRRRA